MKFMGIKVVASTRGFIDASLAGDFVLCCRNAGVKVKLIRFHPALVVSMCHHPTLWERYYEATS